MAWIKTRHPRTLGLSRAVRQASLTRQASEVGSDALALPIAIAGRFGSFWALQLLWRRLAVIFGSDCRSLPARFGLGQRTLGGRGELLAVGNGRLVTHRWAF